MAATGTKRATNPRAGLPRETADENQPEQWRNTTRSTVGIARFNADGTHTIDSIGGDETFYISTADRQRNESIVRDPARKSPFRNGFLIPVDLPGDVPERDFLITNPANVTNDEIAELLDAPVADFETYVKSVTSTTLMHRIHSAVREADAGPRRSKAARDRLKQLDSTNPLVGDNVATGKEAPITPAEAEAGRLKGVGPEPKQYDSLPAGLE